MVWDIHSECRETAKKFVTREIGLFPSSIQHHVFVDYWLKSVLPEVIYQPPFEPNKNTSVWFDTKVKKIGNEIKIVDSVNWNRGEVSKNEVANYIRKVPLEVDNSWLLKHAKGGRYARSEELKLYPEAIVCALLKDKQKLVYKEIARIFNWKLSKDDHNISRMSNTTSDRVKLGRRILQRRYNP
jgi:hypothetical protein